MTNSSGSREDRKRVPPARHLGGPARSTTNHRREVTAPEVGEVWRTPGGDRREVDYLGPTHVGYRGSSGVRTLVTHAVWRKWAAGAERVTR